MSSDEPLTAAPAPPGYTINLTNPEYIGYQLVIVSIVCAGLSTLFIILRLYTRQLIVRNTGWDDFWIVCAWLNAVALTVADCVQTRYGTGTHIWNVTVDSLATFLKIQLILGSTYIGALAFAKISICCFYLRLSPNRGFRILVYGVIAFTAAYSIQGFLVILFSCDPIAASWDPALAALPTTRCINRPAQYMANAAINIFTDLVILVLPMRTIWGLQLPLRQKISVTSIFAIGLFVCIISMIRLKSIVVVLNSSDVTWVTSDLLIWSTLEAHICLVCACIATLKPLANRFFPKLLGKSASSGGPYPTIPGKGAKLTGSSMPQEGRAFAMQSYRQRAEAGEHRAVVVANTNRNHEVDGSSQESIIGGRDPFAEDYKEAGVYVTTTVHVS